MPINTILKTFWLKKSQELTAELRPITEIGTDKDPKHFENPFIYFLNLSRID